MTRNYFITFKDDIDASSFVMEYNNIVKDVRAVKYAGNIIVEEENDSDDDNSCNGSSSSRPSCSTGRDTFSMKTTPNVNKEHFFKIVCAPKNESEKDISDHEKYRKDKDEEDDSSSTSTGETKSSEDAKENGDSDASSFGGYSSDVVDGSGENDINGAASFDSFGYEACTQDWPDEFKKLNF